jgi:hypothetical protein
MHRNVVAVSHTTVAGTASLNVNRLASDVCFTCDVTGLGRDGGSGQDLVEMNSSSNGAKPRLHLCPPKSRLVAYNQVQEQRPNPKNDVIGSCTGLTCSTWPITRSRAHTFAPSADVYLYSVCAMICKQSGQSNVTCWSARQCLAQYRWPRLRMVLRSWMQTHPGSASIGATGGFCGWKPQRSR